MDQRPALVSKSFEVTGITKNKDDASVCSAELQDQIAAGFDIDSMSDVDGESEEEGNSEGSEENAAESKEEESTGSDEDKGSEPSE